MKKKNYWLILFSLMMVLFPSCKKEAINSPTRPMRITLPDDVISYYEENYGTEAGAAFQTAAQTFKMLYPETYSHLVNNDFDISLECYTSHTLQEVFPGYSSEFDDTLMYIVNLSRDNGFALVTDSMDVLAISNNGNLTLNDLTTHPYSEQYNENPPKWMLASLVNTKMISRDSLAQIFRTIAYAYYDSVRSYYTDTVFYGPYASMELGQNAPYNYYCYTPDGAHAAAGCVPIAVTNLFSAVEYPEFMYFGYTWQQIKQDWFDNHRNASYFPRPGSPLTALAKIIADIGSDLNIVYDVAESSYSGTTDDYSSLILYLQNLGFTDAHFQRVSSMFDYDYYLTNRKTLYATGLSNADYSSDSTKCHAWVFDGVIHYVQKKFAYENGQCNSEYINKKAVHCNMGWSGKGNGYYDFSLFYRCNDMTTIVDIDESQSSSNFPFIFDIYVITY